MNHRIISFFYSKISSYIDFCLVFQAETLFPAYSGSSRGIDCLIWLNMQEDLTEFDIPI